MLTITLCVQEAHAAQLVEENSSLRALNMSLIHEREQLLVQIRQQDTEVQCLQASLDKLISWAARHTGGTEIACAFRALANKIVAGSSVEISERYRSVLERSVELYEDYHRSDASRKKRLQGDQSVLCPTSSNQAGFDELEMDEPVGSSCDELKELLKPACRSVQLVEGMGEHLEERQCCFISNEESRPDRVRKEGGGPEKDAGCVPWISDEVSSSNNTSSFFGANGLDMDEVCGDVGNYECLFITATAC